MHPGRLPAIDAERLLGKALEHEYNLLELLRRPGVGFDTLAEVTRIAEVAPRVSRETLAVEWGAGFFPVILIVFVLRSFLFEPFKIPSGSMIPTLLVGDFILVNKFTYGVRLPVINKKIIDMNSPQRGDVMVFRYPEDPSLDYIKRVVGLPGDTVSYQNKRLTINGKAVPTQKNRRLPASRATLLFRANSRKNRGF